MAGLELKYAVPSAEEDFLGAGEASTSVKKKLRQIGYNPEAVRKVAIAMYEGEINMAIHAGGGEAEVEILPQSVTIKLIDHGPGIADVEKAMQEGWSTAPEEVRSLGFGILWHRWQSSRVHTLAYCLSWLIATLSPSAGNICMPTILVTFRKW